MVEFNKLLILPYNKGIFLDVSIPSLPYFKQMYIDRIVIDTQDTFNKDGISRNPVYTYQVEGNRKSLELTINDTDLLVPTMEGNMFFIYVITKGFPAPDTPCGMDEPVTLGVGVDSYRIYRKGIEYIQETYNSCNVPRHFIDFILRYKAFEMCLKTRDYPLAITYWKKFLRQLCSKSPSTNTCGCHG